MTQALIDFCDGLVVLALLVAVVLWTDHVRETHRRARAITHRRRLAMDERRAYSELYAQKTAAAPLATARRPTHRGDFDEYAK